jgi:PadR family transcriptional regulator PadR
MPRLDNLGEFEQIVLLALLRLGDAAYGMAVRREIESRTSRHVAIGAVYATLDRMEKKGLVKSSLGDPSPERGGRAKRSFRLTALGSASLKQSQRSLKQMTQGLSPELIS